MKQSKDYQPDTDAGLAIWHNQYGAGIGISGPLLGLTDTEISLQEEMAAEITEAIYRAEIMKAQASEAVAFKRRILKEKGGIIRKCIARMKTHPAYTEDIGKHMGVVASGSVTDLSTARPVLKVSALPGYIRICFHKYRMEGVVVFSRLKGAGNWQRLGADSVSPFIDRRPLIVENQPEIREYMAMFTTLREPVGQQSDIVSVVFGG